MSLRLLAIVLIMTAEATAFDGQTAKTYLDTLCRPEFAGRKSGDPEAHQAELWVAGKLAEFGLQPGGTEGYLQAFPILCNREEKAELELVNGYHGRRRYQDGEDFELVTNSGSGEVKAEVVFIGYGIAEPGRGRDDFNGMDLRGKVALIYKAIPGSERDWEKQFSRDYKLKAAVSRGAVAVLFVNEQFAISGAAIHQEAFFPKIPVLMVSEKVVEDIFRGTGKRYQTVKKALEKNSQSFATGKVMRGQTKLRYNPQAQAANVLGILPGSDSTLKDEWIVIGGHLDHNGVNAAGDIFYGADDNASGAAIVIELARSLATSEIKSKRSLMFIAFAGEEQGLLGSQYFADHPTVPLEQIAAMINFDCCGVGKGGVGFGGVEHFPEIWDAYKATLTPDELDNISLSTIWRNGSDNHSFQIKGVPTFNFWSRGDRSFYHLQEDLPVTVSEQALGGVGQAAQKWITYLADWDKPLLQEHYRARTWLYSAYTVNLQPCQRAEALDTTQFIAHLKQEQQYGLKCQAVEVSASDPYGEVDFWRQFCPDHGFVWATTAEEIRGAVRQHKLALWPVITDLKGLDEQGAHLRNLKRLGVKTILVSGVEMDSVKAALSQELGMLFIVSAEAVSAIPKEAKRVILNPTSGLFASVQKDDLHTLRIALPLGSAAVRPDSAGLVARTAALRLAWDAPESQQADELKQLEDLEKAGFTDQQIIYMLGENLLEVLPE